MEDEYNKRRRKACNKYEKTKNGFLMRTYRNMKSRVEGNQKLKAHLYAGLELLDKLEFYEWSKSDIEFNSLFDKWELSGYDRKITPSIDRRNSDLGYTLDNLRWLTHSENSRLGALGNGRPFKNKDRTK